MCELGQRTNSLCAFKLRRNLTYKRNEHPFILLLYKAVLLTWFNFGLHPTIIDVYIILGSICPTRKFFFSDRFRDRKI
jgi:hypothetical protein